MTTLSRYYSLLDEAAARSLAEDDFDLVSGNPESERIFRELRSASIAAQIELVTYAAANRDALLKFWKGER